jgi:hypothetical protein
MNEKWLLVEDGRLLNVSMITDIRFDEKEQRAACWGYELPIFSHSRILFDIFWPIRQRAMADQEAARQAVKSPPVDSPKES